MEVLGAGVAVRDVAVHLDAFPEPDRKYRANELSEAGGGPVPTALVTLTRFGRGCAFVGVVGDDTAGRSIVDDLVAEGIDTAGVTVRPGYRSPASVILVERGRRTILEWAQHDLPLRLADVALERIPFADVRIFLADARLVDVQLELARRVRAHGGRVVLDCGHPRPGVDALLAVTDYAILSHTYPETVLGPDYDALAFLESVARLLPGDGPRVAGLTLGPRGCAIYSEATGLVRIPAHAVRAVDSTGAGDVFHGAFAHAILGGDSAIDAARFANVAAALKCTGLTGRFRLPAEAEIRARCDPTR